MYYMFMLSKKDYFDYGKSLLLQTIKRKIILEKVTKIMQGDEFMKDKEDSIASAVLVQSFHKVKHRCTFT